MRPLQCARNFSIWLGGLLTCPSQRQIQVGLLLLGVGLLSFGLAESASAAYSAQARFNDDRIAEAADVIQTYLRGSFGALVMVCCGVAAILSAAFGQYRAALGLLVVAVGAFILRSLVATWFNDSSLQSA
jgi:hypothetical protein